MRLTDTYSRQMRVGALILVVVSTLFTCQVVLAVHIIEEVSTHSLLVTNQNQINNTIVEPQDPSSGEEIFVSFDGLITLSTTTSGTTTDAPLNEDAEVETQQPSTKPTDTEEGPIVTAIEQDVVAENEQKPATTVTQTQQIETRKVSGTTYTPTSFSLNDIVTAHNYARAPLRLTPISWSPTLAHYAKLWADELADKECTVNHEKDSPYGENIYMNWTNNTSMTGLLKTPEEVVARWMSEEPFYNYTKNSCAEGELCSHYTQIVWADTTEVGCAVASCVTRDKKADVWVCKYNPPGNNGLRPY